MRSINSIILMYFILINLSFSQILSSNKLQKIYPLPGSHFLIEKEKIIQNYLKEHPRINRLERPANFMWNFSVGDSQNWWATNLVNYNEYEVSSTCRAIGTHCYIFVEDAIWDTRITQSGVNSILDDFVNRTPNDPNKGIYQTDVEAFGEPPDVDNDPRIIILILDIQDGFTGSGGYVAGYFYSANEYPDGDVALGGTRSNYAEIYYIDANPADLTSQQGISEGMATTAHEFQHMIHWRWDSEEVTFINEGCSMIAEHICGYNLEYWFNLYQEDTNRYLFYWDDEDPFPDYARAALWTLYLYEQFPVSFLSELVKNQDIGSDGIESTLENNTSNIQLPPGRHFNDVFRDWLIANYVNDNTLARNYYYDYAPLSKPIPIATHFGGSDISETTNSISSLAAHYISFIDGNNLSMSFNSSSDKIKIVAIKMGSTEIEDVPINETYSPIGYGDMFSEVTFVIYNTSLTASGEYSYSAIGPEISYDDGLPEGYIDFLSPGDSVAVHFNGKPGTQLDSIRIAFKRPGPIQMGIWKFTGSYETSPFGAILYGPEELNSTDSTSAQPYPVPFDNWFTVDLTDQKIDVNDDFIVSFLIGNNPSAPGIMYSSEQADGVKDNYRSYFYSNIYKSGGWDYILDSVNRGNINKLLVRAYTSPKKNDLSTNQYFLDDSIPVINLYQNSPNPFNPTTSIKYSISQRSDIKLIIYDIVGNEIYSLFKGSQGPGDYVVQWDGKDKFDQPIGNGVYFYTLHVDDIIQTKKMVFLK